MKQGYEGAPAGIGAIYTWAGNSEVGEGRMTLSESRPSDLVRIRLEFLKPFATTSTAEFSFKPEGDHTAVTWSMTGKVNFMAKVVHLFMGHGPDDRGQFREGAGAIEIGGGGSAQAAMRSGGWSRARLGRMHDIMAGYVERGDVPGIVTLVSRRGGVQVDAIGTKAVGGGDPDRRETIFRIASLTKPITAAATMILVEECRLRLDEPVHRLLPELAHPQGLKRLDGPP